VEEVEVPAGIGTGCGPARAFCMKRGGDWQTVFAEKKLVRAAVNQELPNPEPPSRRRRSGVLPPVTGG